MAEETLYALLGVTPTTPPAAIAAALQARLAQADDEERALLAHARDTLLSVPNRESYDRLHGLRGPLTPEERLGTLAITHPALVAHLDAPPAGPAWVELSLVAHLLAIAALLSLWYLALRWAQGALMGEAARLLALGHWEAHAPLVVMGSITLFFGLIGLLGVHLYTSEMAITARFIIALTLVTAALVLALRQFSPDTSPILMLGAILPLFLGAVALIRHLGTRDLANLGKRHR